MDIQLPTLESVSIDEASDHYVRHAKAKLLITAVSVISKQLKNADSPEKLQEVANSMSLIAESTTKFLEAFKDGQKTS
jgi:hypothetical protein